MNHESSSIETDNAKYSYLVPFLPFVPCNVEYKLLYVYFRQHLEQESTEVESESSKKASTKETSSRKKISRKEKASKNSPKKNMSSPISTKKVDTEVSVLQEAIIRILPDPDPMTEFSKIPPSEKLELLDPLTRYEYKIQTILLLEKILDLRESPKVKGKSPRKKEETVSFSFRDIDPELIAEVLQQRFFIMIFKRGNWKNY